MIIARPLEKIKSWGRGPALTRILPILALVLYGAAMFCLGLSTHLETPKNPSIQVVYDKALDPQLEYAPKGTASGDSSSSQKVVLSGTSQKTFSLDAKFVASASGTKYYPIGCGSVSRIKEENRIYFVTEEEAKAAGLEMTTACK